MKTTAERMVTDGRVAEIDRHGRFRFTGLAAGSYELEIWLDGQWRHTRRIDLRERQTRRLSLRLGGEPKKATRQ